MDEKHNYIEYKNLQLKTLKAILEARNHRYLRTYNTDDFLDNLNKGKDNVKNVFRRK